MRQSNFEITDKKLTKKSQICAGKKNKSKTKI